MAQVESEVESVKINEKYLDGNYLNLLNIDIFLDIYCIIMKTLKNSSMTIVIHIATSFNYKYL